MTLPAPFPFTDAISLNWMPPSPERERVVAVLNGVLGDALEARGHALAIPMRLRRDGVPLELTPAALEAATMSNGVTKEDKDADMDQWQ